VPLLPKRDLVESGKETQGQGPSRARTFSRYVYDRFLRLHGSPKQIAWGAAVGLFVAMTPTMGIQTLLAVPLAAFLKISKVAAATTVWVTNPVTAPFLYGLNYMIGARLLGHPPEAPFLSNPCWETLWNSGRHVVLSLTLGGLITGIIVAFGGYFVVLAMVTEAREKAHRLKERMKREKPVEPT
jgi:uncharacterized protein (DUF2062 family)